jgi:hypothetical protein
MGAGMKVPSGAVPTPATGAASGTPLLPGTCIGAAAGAMGCCGAAGTVLACGAAAVLRGGAAGG